MTGNSVQKVTGNSGQIRYARVPESVLHDGKLSVSARLIYAEMALWVFQGSVTRVGQRRIAAQLGYHQETVSLGIQELVNRGHVKVLGKGKTRRSYILQSPVFSQKQGQETVVVSAPSGARRMVSVDLEREKVG